MHVPPAYQYILKRIFTKYCYIVNKLNISIQNPSNISPRAQLEVGRTITWPSMLIIIFNLQTLRIMREKPSLQDGTV